MEEILKKMQKEASGSKYKAIKESCTWALGKRKERGAGRRAPASLSGAGAPARCSRGPRGLGLKRPLCVEGFC